MGAVALHLAYEAFWEPALNPWDIAAEALLVERRMSHMTGTPLHVDCRDVLASNGRVHEETVTLLGGGPILRRA